MSEHEVQGVELVWPGKTREVTSVVLPFQSIEQIDEPRAEEAASGSSMDLFSVAPGGRQLSGWTNKLIWGDNKLILSSLANGPLRREIEAAGGLKLVYVDPPFDVGADFSFDISVGEEDTLTKQPNVIEEIAYRDTWGQKPDSYLSMIFERLLLIRQLMTDDGSIFVHCDWHVGHALKSVCDEVFGSGNFMNEVVWYYYNKFQGNVNRFASNHDTLFWYRKSAKYTFNQIKEERDKTSKQIKRVWDKDKGKIVNAKGEDGKVLYIETDEKTIDDVWRLSMLQPADKTENLAYSTQKPESLLTRVISATSNPGDLVADFFCGSGTTLAVAEKLGRKWIGCDLGRFAIHTTRKRMIGVQRELKAADKPYRAFEILNLGKYERQFFSGINPNLSEEEKIVLAVQKEEQYLNLILSAYRAERVLQSPPFHGRQGSTMVVVGPLDAPVTQSLLHEAVNACRRLKVSKVDILGFDFEMGLMPYEVDQAREKGVAVQLRYIPRDVFDKRAVEKGQVKFYDVAYVEVKAQVEGRKVRLTLSDFGVYYRQDDDEGRLDKLKPGVSKVIVKNGQVVKVTRTGGRASLRAASGSGGGSPPTGQAGEDGRPAGPDGDKSVAATGEFEEEVLTKQWTDWIDYWAVDYDFFTRPEQVRIIENGVERSTYTGNYLFENEWQSFRTRKNRALELTSAWHEYDLKGLKKSKKTLAVKVIDIFGNDTTKVVEVWIDAAP